MTKISYNKRWADEIAKSELEPPYFMFIQEISMGVYDFIGFIEGNSETILKYMNQVERIEMLSIKINLLSVMWTIQMSGEGELFDLLNDGELGEPKGDRTSLIKMIRSIKRSQKLKKIQKGFS